MKGLQEFGLSDLAKLNFVSDRGSNFVKALTNASPLFCYAHRLNNVLKRAFFQSTKKRAESSSSRQQKVRADMDSSSSSEDDDELLASIIRLSRRKEKQTIRL